MKGKKKTWLPGRIFLFFFIPFMLILLGTYQRAGGMVFVNAILGGVFWCLILTPFFGYKKSDDNSYKRSLTPHPTDMISNKEIIDAKESKLKSNASSENRAFFARILISRTSAFVPDLLEIMMAKENIKANQNLLMPLKIELLILELHFYYLSFCKFGKEMKAREIIEEIKNAIISDITNEESTELTKLYDERMAFYGEMKNILPSEEESPKGTLFWEFGKLMCSTYHSKVPGAFLGFPILLPELIKSISEAAFGND